MRVCVLGSFEPDYARHAILCEGLARVGVEVTLRRIPSSLNTIGRTISMIRQFPKRERFDAVFIPAFNQTIAPSAWIMGCLFGKPILLDYLVGLTDTNQDRQTRGGWRTAVFRWIDRFNIDRMTSLTDTDAHRQLFRDLMGSQAGKMHVVPVGVRHVWDTPSSSNDTIIVQFIGTYIPFHGVDVIIRAAHLLRDHPEIRFQLIGKGQTYALCRQVANDLDLKNIDFMMERFSYDELYPLLCKADISLGVFGASDKMDYVVPTKIYDALSAARPLITAESRAVREFFTPDEHLLTVQPDDPQALANAIRTLVQSPERRAALGTAGAQRIQTAFLPEHIGQIVKDTIVQMNAR